VVVPTSEATQATASVAVVRNPVNVSPGPAALRLLGAAPAVDLDDDELVRLLLLVA
jgi:hypothetical protein